MTKEIYKLNFVQLRRLSNRKLTGRERSLKTRINKSKNFDELVALDQELVRVRKEKERRKKKD